MPWNFIIPIATFVVGTICTWIFASGKFAGETRAALETLGKNMKESFSSLSERISGIARTVERTETVVNTHGERIARIEGCLEERNKEKE